MPRARGIDGSLPRRNRHRAEARRAEHQRWHRGTRSANHWAGGRGFMPSRSAPCRRLLHDAGEAPLMTKTCPPCRCGLGTGRSHEWPALLAPPRERIGQLRPGLGAEAHFGGREETSVQLGPQRRVVEAHADEHDLLSPIAEWRLPVGFNGRAVRRIVRPVSAISRRPPEPGPLGFPDAAGQLPAQAMRVASQKNPLARITPANSELTSA